MFDVGTQITHATGEEPRSSYLGNPPVTPSVWFGDNQTIWYFGGNPIVPDEHYLPNATPSIPPEAISSTSGLCANPERCRHRFAQL